MNKTGWLIASGVSLVASAPLLTNAIPLSLFPSTLAQLYSANKDFSHQVGVPHGSGWEAYYREHHPGYLAKGLRSGGDLLTHGTYRYDFYFALRPGHFTGLLSGANDVVRLEAADTTAKETVLDRTFQIAGFSRAARKGFIVKKPHVFHVGPEGAPV